ncbi:hypothetical protein [Noviherbaspirillum sp.]|uniref:hypothetical protein n=1 Tax=Noviherbaspirillum sp. TaxID=1926288 RepID=UPI002B475A4E|nr:hypothetical protein [Noviherbaspirillum sp.]HJV83046.1 hypothetical protein [Noviherbaspirillum sp.]
MFPSPLRRADAAWHPDTVQMREAAVKTESGVQQEDGGDRQSAIALGKKASPVSFVLAALLS